MYMLHLVQYTAVSHTHVRDEDLINLVKEDLILVLAGLQVVFFCVCVPFTYA